MFSVSYGKFIRPTIINALVPLKPISLKKFISLIPVYIMAKSENMHCIQFIPSIGNFNNYLTTPYCVSSVSLTVKAELFYGLQKDVNLFYKSKITESINIKNVKTSVKSLYDHIMENVEKGIEPTHIVRIAPRTWIALNPYQFKIIQTDTQLYHEHHNNKIFATVRTNIVDLYQRSLVSIRFQRQDS